MNRSNLARRFRSAGRIAVLTGVLSVANPAGVRAAGSLLTLSPVDFAPAEGSDPAPGSGEALTHGTYFARLALPPGAAITKLTLFALDGDAVADVAAFLRVSRPSTGSDRPLVEVATHETADGLRTEVATVSSSSGLTAKQVVYAKVVLPDEPVAGVEFRGLQVNYAER